MESIDDLYIKQEEPQRGCLLALRHIILAHNDAMVETIKYGMPCFCYKKKIICYLWADNKTKEPYVLMSDGNRLDFPELEQGSRKKMKILKIDANEDIPLELIEGILATAIDLHSQDD